MQERENIPYIKPIADAKFDSFSFKDTYSNIETDQKAEGLDNTVTTSEDRLRPDVEIKIIGQMHKRDDQTELKKEETTKSQFLILKEIQKHPNALVFLESLDKDFTPESRNLLLAFVAQSLFPSGNIPDDFSQLTEKQKQFIYDFDGVITAYLLGFVNSLHKSTTSQDRELIDLEIQILMLRGKLFNRSGSNGLAKYDDFTPKGKDLVYNQREACLEREIVQVTNQPKNKGKEVIIVFGAAHIKTLSKRFKDNITSIIDLSKIDK